MLTHQQKEHVKCWGEHQSNDAQRSEACLPSSAKKSEMPGLRKPNRSRSQKSSHYCELWRLSPSPSFSITCVNNFRSLSMPRSQSYCLIKQYGVLVTPRTEQGQRTEDVMREVQRALNRGSGRNKACLSVAGIVLTWTFHLKCHTVCLNVILLRYRITCLWLCNKRFCNKKGVLFVSDPA